jgi:hypothetical protein
MKATTLDKDDHHRVERKNHSRAEVEYYYRYYNYFSKYGYGHIVTDDGYYYNSYFGNDNCDYEWSSYWIAPRDTLTFFKNIFHRNIVNNLDLESVEDYIYRFLLDN